MIKQPWRNKKRQTRMRTVAWKQLCDKQGENEDRKCLSRERKMFKEGFDAGYSAAVFIYENELSSEEYEILKTSD